MLRKLYALVCKYKNKFFILLIIMRYRNRIKLGKIQFRKNFIIMIREGFLQIGNGTCFNNNCSINCMGSIKIGDNCLFGESVKLYDHNHIYSDPYKNIIEQGFNIGKIEIGNNCWIGSNVTILNNVTVGDNVIIGANSLIYKSIPSNTIVKCKSEIVITSR